MWRWFYDDNPLLGLALFSLVFFVAFFVATVVRTMRQPGTRIDSLAAMPLMDDDRAAVAARTETNDV